MGANMISSIAKANFHHVRSWLDAWETWDPRTKSNQLGGMVFDVNPIRQFFPRSFARKLTPVIAKRRLHHLLAEWADVAKRESLFAVHKHALFPDDMPPTATPRTDGELPEIWWKVPYAYYNVCSLATYEQTIEQLIFTVFSARKSYKMSRGQLLALLNLVSLNKAFLAAEWMQDVIIKATANSDDDIFQAISLGLQRNTIRERRDTVDRWVNVMLLWYLGGSEIRPRKLFKHELADMKILPRSLTDFSFAAMLANLGLTSNKKHK